MRIYNSTHAPVSLQETEFTEVEDQFRSKVATEVCVVSTADVYVFPYNITIR
jgi:hypothetical protein